VLVEAVEDGVVEGRSAHQAPEVDGITMLVDGGIPVDTLQVGSLVTGLVTASDGVDLVATVQAVVRR
jgi:hypothetical protein